MKRIEWHPKLNIGVEQIDEQHKRLVQLANNLISAIQTGVAEDILEVICKELHEYTVFHFRDEELLMQEVGYPHLEQHQKKHREITDQVQAYLDALERDNNVPPQDVLDFMGDWLVEHIIYMDMKIGDHIKEQNVPTPPNAD